MSKKRNRTELKDNITFDTSAGRFEGITQKDKDEWKKRYPHIYDIDWEIEIWEQWLFEHPKRAKEILDICTPQEFIESRLGIRWELLETTGISAAELLGKHELAKRQESSKGGGFKDAEWSKPLSLKQIAIIFDVHTNTMRSWLRQQTICNRQISTRRWRIPIDEFPAELVKKARNSE